MRMEYYTGKEGVRVKEREPPRDKRVGEPLLSRNTESYTPHHHTLNQEKPAGRQCKSRKHGQGAVLLFLEARPDHLHLLILR